MNVGTRINELRKKSNITMQQLSHLTGISQPVLSKLETGHRTPDVPILEKICQALNITLSEFFNEDIKVNLLTPELREFFESTKNLTPSQLEALKLLIDKFKK